MTVRIWGMIQIVERKAERDGNFFPVLVGLVCIGQVEKSKRYQITHSRFLEEARRLASDSDIQEAVYGGSEEVMMAAMKTAISVCQAELLTSFREVKHNIEEMRGFVSELGHETAVHPKIVLAGTDEDRWEVGTEDELIWVGSQFLPSQRVVGWLKAEFDRHDPQAARRR